MQLSKRLPYLLVAGCSILYFAPFLRVLSHSGDEGELINDAVRVTQGQLPFRDFFEGMAPGTYYLLAFYFKLLGTTWFATRVSLLVTTVVMATALFYLARRLGREVGAAPVVFFVAVSYHSWNVVSHHMDSNAFALLSFVALVLWIERQSRIALLLAGAGAGLTTCFLQPKGACLFLSFLVIAWLYARRWRPLAELTAAYAAVGLAILAWFAAQGGLKDLIYANLVWPLTTYRGVNAVYYGLGFRELYWKAWTESLVPALSPGVGIPLSVLLSLPFLVVLAMPLLLGWLALRFRKTAFNRLTWPYWIAGCALFVSGMERKDLAHVVYGSPILLVLAFHLYGQLKSRFAARALQAVMACAVMLAALNPLVALLTNNRTVTRRGVVYDSVARDPVLDFLMAHTKPGEPVFVYPYAPMYYFLTATENPTRFNFMMYNFHTESHFREAVEALERRQVRYIVWDRAFLERAAIGFPAYRQPPADKLIVEPYLTEHYTVVGNTSWGFQFLERKGCAAAPKTDAISTQLRK